FRRPTNRLKRPVIARRVPHLHGRLAGWNGGAAVDPGAQQSNLAIAEALPLGRHDRHFLAAASDGLDEPAGVACAWHEGRAGVAAEASGADAVEAQAGALFLRPVAGDAMLRQDRLDVADVIGRRLGGGESARQKSGQTQGQEGFHRFARRRTAGSRRKEGSLPPLAVGLSLSPYRNPQGGQGKSVAISERCARADKPPT